MRLKWKFQWQLLSVHLYKSAFDIRFDGVSQLFYRNYFQPINDKRSAALFEWRMVCRSGDFCEHWNWCDLTLKVIVPCISHTQNINNFFQLYYELYSIFVPITCHDDFECSEYFNVVLSFYCSRIFRMKRAARHRLGKVLYSQVFVFENYWAIWNFVNDKI